MRRRRWSISERAGGGAPSPSSGDLAAPVGGSCVGGCAGDGVQPALDREAGGAVERRGADGLGDRRRSNGTVPVLDEAGLAGLAAALEQGPEDSGLWSGRKVAAWNRLLLRNFSCTPLA